PRPPYDATGYNLSYSMAVKFDRIFDAFDGPFEKIPDVVKLAGKVTPPPATVRIGAYVIDGHVNDAFVAVNRLLAAKQQVVRASAAFSMNGKTYPAGTFQIPGTPEATAILQNVA